MEVSQWVTDLRKLADVIEQGGVLPTMEVTINIWKYNSDGLATTAKAIGGQWEKSELPSHFILRQKVGVHRIDVFSSRENVCEKVVTGTETVTIPDPDAPMVTVEREVYEWKCPPSILAMTGEVGEWTMERTGRNSHATNIKTLSTATEEPKWCPL